MWLLLAAAFVIGAIAGFAATVSVLIWMCRDADRAFMQRGAVDMTPELDDLT